MRYVFLGALLLISTLAVAAAPPVAQLQLPPGFHVSVYSDAVPTARAMTLGAKGTVFVGSMGAGVVYALTDPDHSGHAEHVYVIAEGLDMPVGVAFHDGDLYISSVDRIVKLPDIEDHLADPPTPVVVTDKLPDKRHHGWRFIAFGPDGWLYVGVGAPCNICDPPPPYASIIRMQADGSGWQTVARGVRNTVGFDWQPGTGKLWFTDNGRDMLGDNQPSDELNRVGRAGENFGYPYCHAVSVSPPHLHPDSHQ